MESLVHLDPLDNVGVATETISAGQVIHLGDQSITARASVAHGHKIALRSIASGEAVTKYGQAIGIATANIAVGDHVHVHNVADHHVIDNDVSKTAPPAAPAKTAANIPRISSARWSRRHAQLRCDRFDGQL